MMFGVSSMTAMLRRVAVYPPSASLLQADPLKWHYGPEFDPAQVTSDHDNFVSILKSAGTEVVIIEQDDRGIADAVFTYDASLVTPAGAVLMAPGKSLRFGEQTVHKEFYDSQGIPIVGELTGSARAEAGDTLWVDDSCLAVGRGFRTNPAGVTQLTGIMAGQGIEVHAFDMPVYGGRAACLHLMSLISLVDTRKALVVMELLPVAFYELLLAHDYTLIAAPFEEFRSTGTLSTNVLALAPGHCVMVDNIPQTRKTLEDAGVRVEVFSGASLCIGCEGGPTCMTRPLLRR